MFARRAIDVVILGPAVAVSAAVVLIADDLGPADFVFLAVLMWCALTVLRMVLDAARRAGVERRRAGILASTAAGDIAQRAVAEERVRLAADIEAVIRASVTIMGEHARSAQRRWDADPVPPLVGIQDEDRRAATELRRLLGLLREAERAGEASPVPAAAPRPARTGILLGVAAATLAVAERYPATADVPAAMQTTTSLILTALAAATISLHRSAPALGATACGAVFAAGAISGDPVSPGFWILLTPAVLAWAAMAARTWQRVAGVVVLIAGIAADLGWHIAAVGVVAIPYGGGDDAPGLVLIGILLIVGAFAIGVRTAHRRGQGVGDRQGTDRP